MMSKALKGSLAAAAGLALGLGGVGAASAQEEEENPTPTATGTVSTREDGVGLHGSIDGNQEDVSAQLLELQLSEDDTRLVYCIQITEPLQPGNVYEERPWEDIPVEDLPMVLGVLTAGYNGSNAGALIDAAGMGDDGEDPYDGYSQDQIAYAGTQAAIWSLTDGWEIDAEDPTVGDEGADQAVLAVQQHLLDNAVPVEEPEFDPYFEVDDSEAKIDGNTVGPFQIGTNLGPIGFTQPEGATIVDENGEAIETFDDGQMVYVEFADTPSESVSVTTDTVTWSTPVGRVFVPTSTPAAEFVPQAESVSEYIEGQRVILAEEYSEEISAELQFDIALEEAPSESPKPQLPVTGSSLTTFAGIGGAVLVAGVVAMVLMRRRAAAAGGAWGDDK